MAGAAAGPAVARWPRMLRFSWILVLAGCVEHFDAREDYPEGPLDESGLVPRAAPLTPLQRLSGCLTFDDFEAAGVGRAFGAVDAAHACSNCHAGEFQLDDHAMFSKITGSRVVLARYLKATGTRVEPELVASDRTLTSVASRIGQYQEHPGFDVRDVLLSLDTWSALATQRQRDGMCGPPTAE